jgi:hypothetical protein
MPTYVLPPRAVCTSQGNSVSVLANGAVVYVWSSWPANVQIILMNADEPPDDVWGDLSYAVEPWSGRLKLPLGKAVYCKCPSEVTLQFSCEGAFEVTELTGKTNLVYQHNLV